MQDSSGNPHGSDACGAKSGAPRAPEGANDPDLAAVVNAWPTLPPAVKTGIVAMVKASGSPC